jgi:hypothetical protein
MEDKVRLSTEEWYNDMAVEVQLPTHDDFLKIKETLTRIGIGTHKEGRNKLYQTCHILQKRGCYFIVHFKELLLLDGKEVDISDFDIKRRNTIISFLEEWGLVKDVRPAITAENKAKSSAIKVIPFADKMNWDLIPKYTIGSKG